jgi:AraC family transcriptional activator of pobA
LAKNIKTFTTNEFMNRFMKPAPALNKLVKPDYGRFFITKVQDLIKMSQVPVPPARSTTHIIIYLTSGVATMRIGFHPVRIRKNECLVVPAEQVFSYDKYEVNTGYIAVFDSNFLVGKLGSNELVKEFDFLNIWGNPVIQPGRKTAPYIDHTLQRVFADYAANGLSNRNIIQSYFLAFLCELQSAYKPLSNSKSKTAIHLTNRFKELLHQNIRTKHLVTEYAGMLHVSANHLNKTIKATTRKSTSRWIDETLIIEAKVLLFQTNNSINEIAAELGIHDQSYFSRLFKKYEGMTPLEFRKMIEKS